MDGGRSADVVGRGPALSRRRVSWLVAVAVLGAVDLAATIHAHLSFHRTPTGPSVMPLTQVLGWITSVLLLGLAITLAAAAVLTARRRRSVAPAREAGAAVDTDWPDIRPTRIEAPE
jgi:hypothetical protein